MSGSILIVEDDADIRTTLSEILLDEGYEVSTAGDGLEALTLLAKQAPPNVILLDVMMPVMDGATFRVEQLKNRSFAAIPVIVISAQGRSADLMDLMRPAAFLQKPFDMDQLLGALTRVFQADPPGAS